LGNDDAYFDVLYAFVSTVLTVYFLPKLAVAKNNQETKTVFWSFIKDITCFILGVTIVYFTRFFIVKLLLRRNFTSDHLFFWQLVGDVSSLIDFRLSVFAKNLQ
jgi:PST family polysaccharide transporter